MLHPCPCGVPVRCNGLFDGDEQGFCFQWVCLQAYLAYLVLPINNSRMDTILRRTSGNATCAILCIVGSFLVGCSGTTWTHSRAAPDYHAPKHITVAISVEAGGEGIHEAAQELRESLNAELRSFGIVTTFVDQAPSRPSAELRVTQWDMGDRWKRYCFLKEGQGHIVVTVRVTLEDERPGYYGVARGYVDGGSFGGSYLNSAAAAGESIAKAIATGIVQ